MAGYRHIRARLLVAALSIAIVAPGVVATGVATAADPTASPSPSTAESPTADPSLSASPAPAPETEAPTPTPSPSATPASAPVAPVMPQTTSASEPTVEGTELVDRRTETSKTYAAGDGTVTTELFSEPIHYRTAPGAVWQPIDLTFRPIAGTDKAARLVDSPVAVTAAPGSDARGFLTVTLDGHPITLRPVSVSRDARASSEPTLDRSSVRIAEALPGIDLIASASSTGVNSFFVLAVAPKDPTITFLVDAPGLTLVADKRSGSIGLVDGTGTRIGSFLKPYAVDSTPDEFTGGGRITSEVAYTLSTIGGLPALTVSVDPAWLASAVYPVYVDPTIYNNGSTTYGDAHVNQGNPSLNYANYQRPDSPGYYEMWLGESPSDSTYYNEAYIKFDLSTIAGTTIDSANLEVRPYHQYYNAPTSTTTWLRRVTATWAENTIKWSNKPAVATGSVDTAACVEGQQCAFAITALVRGWLDGTYTNHGIRLDENGNGPTYWKRLIASEQQTTTRPRLIVTNHIPVATPTTPAGWRNSRALTWSYSDAASHAQANYEFDVDNNSDFSSLVYDGPSTAGAATSAAIPGTVALTSGTTYYWRVRVRDGTSWSAWASSSFQWDATAPSATIAVNNGAAYATATGVTLNVTSSDAHSGVTSTQASNDNATYTAVSGTTPAWTLTSTNGTKTVWYRVTDAAGNATTVSDTIVLDTVNPSATISVANGAAWTTATGVTLNVSASDATSGVATTQASNDNVTYTAVSGSTPSWTLTSANGTKTVWYRVTDAAGRTTTVSDTIGLDTVNPSATIAINNGAATTTSANVTLDVTASDATSGVGTTAASNDNVTFTPVSGSAPAWTLTSGSGTKTVWYRVTDVAGRSTTASDTILLDPGQPSQPTVTATGPGTYQAAPNDPVIFRPAGTTQIDLDATSAPPGGGTLASIRFESLTPGTGWVPTPALPNTDATSPFTESIAASALSTSSTINVIARTGTGIDSLTRTVQLTPDALGPVVEFTSPVEGWAPATVPVAWTETDAGAGANTRSIQRETATPSGGSCTAASWTTDGDPTTSVSPLTESNLVNGMCYRWRIVATDRVGNTSAAITSPAVQVDAELPTANLSAPEAGALLFEVVTLAGIASDNNALLGVEFLLDGASIGSDETVPYSLDWDSTVATDGPHELTLRATDLAGNIADSEPVAITVNNALPGGARVEADFDAGLLTTDERALFSIYAVSAPDSLPTRYVSTTATASNSGDPVAAMAAWDSLSPSTQDEIEAFLSDQPHRGELYDPPLASSPNPTFGPDSAFPACTNQYAGYRGQTIISCVHTTTHFRIEYALKSATRAGVEPVDTVPTNEQGPCVKPNPAASCNGVPDYVDTVARTLEEAYGIYANPAGLNYPEPSPGQLIEVELHEMSGGVVWPFRLVIEMDVNDGAPVYLSRHELFHRFQYAFIDTTDFWSSGLNVWWWLEAGAEWAAHKAEVASGRTDNQFEYSRSLRPFLSEPWEDLGERNSRGHQYGAFIFAEELEARFGTAVIRETWEHIGLGFPASGADQGIADVIGLHAATVNDVLGDFWTKNYRLAYTPAPSPAAIANWRSRLDVSDPEDPPEWRTAADAADQALGAESRPARTRIDVPLATDLEVDPAFIEPGGARFFDLVPVNDSAGTITVDVTQWTGPGVDARLVTFDNYPSRCDEREISFTDFTGTASARVGEGCQFATLVVTNPGWPGGATSGVTFTARFDAGAAISNGTVQLGIRPTGNLIVPGTVPSSGEGVTEVGLRYVPTNADAISPGCFCEGWGVADATSSTSGWANESTGHSGNLVVESFTWNQLGNPGATSVVRVADTFRIHHIYSPVAETDNLFEVLVAIDNISEATVDLRYRRLVDLDVEPTAFDEFLTVTAPGGFPASVNAVTDDPFGGPDPLSAVTNQGHSGQFTDAGPDDNGVLLNLWLGQLDPGQTRYFRLYFGAAESEANAMAAASSVGAEVIAISEPSTVDGPTLGIPNTFIFAFQESGAGFAAGSASPDGPTGESGRELDAGVPAAGGPTPNELYPDGRIEDGP